MAELVLVTGGDGFVGRHLVRVLLERGYLVRSLDRNFKNPVPDSAERVEMDILNRPMIESAMQDVTIVFHLAAATSLWVPDERIYKQVNVDGTRNVLEAANTHKVRRFIYCSSFVTTIHGPRKPLRTVNETDAGEPSTLFGAYARSKRLAELLVHDHNSDMERLVAMPSAPIGAGDYNLTAPTAFIRDLINGKIPATIRQITNFVDVTLLAKALALLAEKGASGDRFLLTGKNQEMGDFLDRVADITGVDMPEGQAPYPVAVFASFITDKIARIITRKAPKGPFAGVQMAGRLRHFDNTKALSELDVTLTPLDDAITEAALWLEREGHLTRIMPKLQDTSAEHS